MANIDEWRKVALHITLAGDDQVGHILDQDEITTILRRKGIRWLGTTKCLAILLYVTS